MIIQFLAQINTDRSDWGHPNFKPTTISLIQISKATSVCVYLRLKNTAANQESSNITDLYYFKYFIYDIFVSRVR